MNKIICTLVTASVLVSGAAYGQSKAKTTHDKQPLRDSQMDKVTAAGEENSAIAANNSTVTENNTGAVNLSGTALEGASGVNIVNSTDALVGNGVNVYDNGSVSGTDAHQSNSISQDSSSAATLSGYHRGQNSQTTINASSNKTSSNTSASSVNSSLNHSTSDTKSYTNDNSNPHSSTDTFAATQ